MSYARTLLYADTVAVLSGWSPPPVAADARIRTLQLLEAGPVAMTREHRPGHVTASAMIADAAGDRVLLCLHGRIDRWMQVGGHCEAGDSSLLAAAVREATEESGIEGLVLHPEPIDLDIHPVPCGPGGSVHHDVRFAAVAPPGAVERISDESRGLAWFAPHALPEPLADATAHLVGPALALARRSASR